MQRRLIQYAPVDKTRNIPILRYSFYFLRFVSAPVEPPIYFSSRNCFRVRVERYTRIAHNERVPEGACFWGGRHVAGNFSAPKRPCRAFVWLSLRAEPLLLLQMAAAATAIASLQSGDDLRGFGTRSEQWTHRLQFLLADPGALLA